MSLPAGPGRRGIPVLGGCLAAGVFLGGVLWLVRTRDGHRQPPVRPVARGTPPGKPAPAKADGHQGTADSGLPPLPGDLVVLGPGRFEMGRGRRKDRPDGPAHPVYVGRFAIAREEVSQADYRVFAEAEGLGPPLPWDDVDDFATIRRLPVNLVSREEAQRYCSWKYRPWGGRLPTEAEWEFAARDGQEGRRFPWGDTSDPSKVNAGRRPPNLMPTGSLPEGATGHGLLHMLGNVAEWTWSAAAPYPGSSAAPPPGAMVRGGTARDAVRDVTPTVRTSLPPESRYAFVGFRCAASAGGP